MRDGNSYTILSSAQVELFLRHGYLILPDCFSRDVARQWVARAFSRLGYEEDEPASWQVERIHLPSTMQVELETFSPRLWAAICDLLGGAGRISKQYIWDSFIINLQHGITRPWEPPTANLPGWHKDGDSFRHFLDSPEQALQVFMVWTDISARGGGTFVACDSIPVIAKYLLAHPEGVLPYDFPSWKLIRQCHVFTELTASSGDAILMHPYLLHTASQNHSGKARIITNPPVELLEPMRFNRENVADYSSVELAILRSLNIERLDFRITAPREKFVPERAMVQQRLLQEEERLGPNHVHLPVRH